MAETVHVTCNRCGGPNGRKHRWCTDCKREYDRDERARAKARSKARVAAMNGQLHAEPCCVCGKDDVPVDVHHDDPSKPLDVRWVCAPCAPLLRRWARRLDAERVAA